MNQNEELDSTKFVLILRLEKMYCRAQQNEASVKQKI